MFQKDSRTEALLTQFGVKWKYTNNLAVTDLSPDWRDTNFGRSQARVDDAVCEYAARMEAGSAAPAPILRNTARGKDILDGVQRIMAEDMIGGTKWSGYIVETDNDLLATKIRVLANHLLQGRPEKPEWTRARAVQLLIIEGGMSVQEIARDGGWTSAAVQEDLDNQRTGFLIRCAGGPTLTKGVTLNIAANANPTDFDVAPKPIAEFCHDLKAGKFSNGDSKEYIAKFFDVNRKVRKRMHGHFEANLEDFRRDSEVEARLKGRKPSKLTPEVRLRQALRSALTVAESLANSKQSIAYMEEFFLLWKQVDRHLKDIGKVRARAKENS